MQKLSKKVLEIAIFRELDAAIGHDLPRPHAKKKWSASSGTSMSVKRSLGHHFLQRLVVPLAKSSRPCSAKFRPKVKSAVHLTILFGIPSKTAVVCVLETTTSDFSQVARNWPEIVIFRQLVTAIGHDCRVLTRKKSGQCNEGLAYESKETTGTTFLQGWWSL